VFQPAHIDGDTLVVLLHCRWRFQIIASGRLSYDGETLTLVGNGSKRVVTDAEIGELQPVTENCRIPECVGFDFFLLVEPS
jgi:hypothetical protein